MSHNHSAADEADADALEEDRIELVSVGIDIGSATSQTVFSRIRLQRLGRELSSRYVVIDREVLYRSLVELTPYAEGLRIDEQGLRRLIGAAFAAAGLAPTDVDTGAIILTGEATRRENARAIADLFATEAGTFVCATAGHHMEATLAAHGSGAVARSLQTGHRVLNIDVGGGTTKFTVVAEGEIRHTAALHIGGRLAAFGRDGLIERLEPGGQAAARAAGIQWHLGGVADPADVSTVAEWMADQVVEACSAAGPHPPLADGLVLTEPLPPEAGYDEILFSGGVSEYITDDQLPSFGDLGHALGAALRARTHMLPGPIGRPAACIRATVLGASQYTVQVSGNTIYVSEPASLPFHNLRVVRPPLRFDETVASEAVAESIEAHARRLELDLSEPVSFAFHWEGPPSYSRLAPFADGIRRALTPRIERGQPVCLIFEGDIGSSVGAILKEELGVLPPVVSLDGVTVSDFEFVDIGQWMVKSATVPISIKSLVFQL